MHKGIKKCRICGNKKLIPVLDLGVQVMTGVFPATKNEKVPSFPLKLVKCDEDARGNFCGLLQLEHSPRTSLMYGDNYGYRSGLNPSMVAHLKEKVRKILEVVPLKKDDLVIDIGSNDGTMLSAYPTGNKLRLVGIDPTGKKFKKYYPKHVRLISNFFSAGLVKKKFPGKKAKIITSIAMFYDLEEPLAFVKEVASVLAKDGVWVFEQSYMPTMLAANAYDTVCHEHLEYYRLKQVKWMLDRAGLKIIDLELNDVNGGSFSVTTVRKNSAYREAIEKVTQLLNSERRGKFHTVEPYRAFEKRVHGHKKELLTLIRGLKKKGKKVMAWGASTKGNVLLQFCGFTIKDIPYVGEVNKEKFGSFTPGTKIPIRSENEIKAMGAEYLLVLPWHFKPHFMKKEEAYRANGGKLIFPLPTVHII